MCSRGYHSDPLIKPASHRTNLELDWTCSPCFIPGLMILLQPAATPVTRYGKRGHLGYSDPLTV